MTTILLPYPPSVNALWRFTKRGYMYKTAKYKEWSAEAGRMLRQQPHQKFNTPVMVVVQAGAPDKRKRDLDNIQKATFDLLEHLGMIENDNLIHHITTYWDRDVKNAVQVTITEMAAQ